MSDLGDAEIVTYSPEEITLVIAFTLERGS
jgi:hypothetical protein